MIDGQEEIRILFDLLAAVDDIDGRHEFLRGNSIGAAVLVILAGNPVLRGIEMGAGMLAKLQPVPRPVRTFLVIVRDGVNLDVGGVHPDFRRQLDQRGFGAECGGQIDDLDLARQQGGGHAGERVLLDRGTPVCGFFGYGLCLLRHGEFLAFVECFSARLLHSHGFSRLEIGWNVDGAVCLHEFARNSGQAPASILPSR